MRVYIDGNLSGSSNAVQGKLSTQIAGWFLDNIKMKTKITLFMEWLMMLGSINVHWMFKKLSLLFNLQPGHFPLPISRLRDRVPGSCREYRGKGNVDFG